MSHQNDTQTDTTFASLGELKDYIDDDEATLEADLDDFDYEQGIARASFGDMVMYFLSVT